MELRESFHRSNFRDVSVVSRLKKKLPADKGNELVSPGEMREEKRESEGERQRNGRVVRGDVPVIFSWAITIR